MKEKQNQIEKIVFSKAELEQIANAKMKCINDMAIITRKETAEKILQIIDFIDKKYQNYAKEELQSSMVAKAFKTVANEIKIELAKQFGVEIKE